MERMRGKRGGEKEKEERERAMREIGREREERNERKGEEEKERGLCPANRNPEGFSSFLHL